MSFQTVSGGLYICPEDQDLSNCKIVIKGRLLVHDDDPEVCTLTNGFVRVVEIDLSQYADVLDNIWDANISIMKKELV